MSKKGEFFESLLGGEYSITTLMHMHDVSRPTVTKWLKERGLEPVANSWPPRYRLDSNTPKESAPKPEEDKSPYTKDMLTAYLNHLLKADTEVDVAKMFRGVANSTDARALIKGLEDTLAVARHYDSFFMEDGLI